MDIRPNKIIEIRKEGSDKTLIRIANLNESEAMKVFDNIIFPTRGEGYEKLLLFQASDEEEMIARRKALNSK